MGIVVYRDYEPHLVEVSKVASINYSSYEEVFVSYPKSS